MFIFLYEYVAAALKFFILVADFSKIISVFAVWIFSTVNKSNNRSAVVVFKALSFISKLGKFKKLGLYILRHIKTVRRV